MVPERKKKPSVKPCFLTAIWASSTISQNHARYFESTLSSVEMSKDGEWVGDIKIGNTAISSPITSSFWLEMLYEQEAIISIATGPFRIDMVMNCHPAYSDGMENSYSSLRASLAKHEKCLEPSRARNRVTDSYDWVFSSPSLRAFLSLGLDWRVQALC